MLVILGQKSEEKNLHQISITTENTSKLVFKVMVVIGFVLTVSTC